MPKDACFDGGGTWNWDKRTRKTLLYDDGKEEQIGDFGLESAMMRKMR